MYSTVEMDIILLNLSLMFRLGFVGIHQVYEIRLEGNPETLRDLAERK
jgi:hypothetical protein